MKTLRSIAAIFLTMLVLVSSSSFMVGIHRCGGSVQNIALFTEADGCPMEQQAMPCHKAVRSACCQDVKVVHEQEEFNAQLNQDQLTTIPALDVASFPVLITVVIPPSTPEAFTPYDPPIRAIDRVVTHHVFII